MSCEFEEWCTSRSTFVINQMEVCRIHTPAMLTRILKQSGLNEKDMDIGFSETSGLMEKSRDVGRENVFPMQMRTRHRDTADG